MDGWIAPVVCAGAAAIVDRMDEKKLTSSVISFKAMKEDSMLQENSGAGCNVKLDIACQKHIE